MNLPSTHNEIAALMGFIEVSPGVYQTIPIFGNQAHALNVNPTPGSGLQGRGRFQVSPGTSNRVKVEFPAGSNITELIVYCWPKNSPAAAQDNDDLVGVLAIDPPSDVVADAWLRLGTDFSAALPASETEDNNVEIIPLRQHIRIPLTDALKNGVLGGGRVDMKSGDESTELNWLIKGQ